MTNQHPITPSPELVEQWADMLSSHSDYAVFTVVARWGAEVELEACSDWLLKKGFGISVLELLDARRSKPSSLKEQALKQLVDLERVSTGDYSAIRRALEALPE